jgi:hypothetical protein
MNRLKIKKLLRLLAMLLPLSLFTLGMGCSLKMEEVKPKIPVPVINLPQNPPVLRPFSDKDLETLSPEGHMIILDNQAEWIGYRDIAKVVVQGLKEYIEELNKIGEPVKPKSRWKFWKK